MPMKDIFEKVKTIEIWFEMMICYFKMAETDRTGEYMGAGSWKTAA